MILTDYNWNSLLLQILPKPYKTMTMEAHLKCLWDEDSPA